MTVTKAGFDLSEISVSNWDILREWFSLDEGTKTDKGWVWADGFGNVVVTANNPITGYYYHDRMGSDMPVKGYTGYVGIEGDEEFVSEFFSSFQDSCEFFKEAEYGKRSFI